MRSLNSTWTNADRNSPPSLSSPSRLVSRFGRRFKNLLGSGYKSVERNFNASTSARVSGQTWQAYWSFWGSSLSNEYQHRAGTYANHWFIIYLAMFDYTVDEYANACCFKTFQPFRVAVMPWLHYSSRSPVTPLPFDCTGVRTSSIGSKRGGCTQP